MACTYFGASSSQVPDHSSTELYRFEEEEEEGGKASHFGYNNSLMHGNESFLSFDQQTNHHQIPVHDPNSSSSTSNSQKLLQDFGCVQSTTSSYTYMKQHKQEEALGWGDYKNGESCSNKRPHLGESMQALKKHCNNATKKSKAKSATTTTTTTPTKDPQSLAAKNRRERISERLKVLQELVPNGSKVDMVTMLEKAIGYVKFLQLQVKVLASDEFWPVQGGKAPDLSQVKNCIDAILSSQRDITSSSK